MNNNLVGKTITDICLADDKTAIMFKTTEGDIVARCDADCCSFTWVEGIELPANGFPCTVISDDDIDMPDLGDMPGCDCVAYYGYEILTDKGNILIDYRNVSNGYYGGSLQWPGDYYYGGVYNQNVSKEEWKSVSK